MSRRLLGTFGRISKRLEAAWESPAARRRLGSALVVGFLGTLVAVELRRLGWLPEAWAAHVPPRHFAAIELAFTLLLVFEVISLVFSLVGSVSSSVGKQFEVFSLILLRKTFAELSHFAEPIRWDEAAQAVLPMLADSVGALLVFAGLAVFYRIQRHRPITGDDEERDTFVLVKRLLALVLLVSFIVAGLIDLRLAVAGQPMYGFFRAFYTILIFADVLLVLISLRYSSTYAVVFRNSGYAAATVFVRIALTSPHYYNAALGVAALAFSIALTLIYNRFDAAPGHA